MIVLHAVVPSDADLGDPGLSVHEAGPVTVLYDEVTRPPSTSRDAVLEQGRRMVALAERVPVLPMRYGTTVRDVGDLRAVVEERGDSWSRRLALLTGCRELVVHLGVAAPARRIDGTGRDYLLRRMDHLEQQDRVVRDVRALLSPWSRDLRRLPDQQRLAVLVSRQDVETTRAALAAWAAAHDVEVIVTGPWPPFSFCEEADA